MKKQEREVDLLSFPYPSYFLSMTMQNADHNLIYASLPSAPLRIFLPTEAEARIPILIDDIIDSTRS